MIRASSAVILIVILSGCSSMSGVGGSDKLSCPMPDGSTCTRLSDVYDQIVHGIHPTTSSAAPTATHVVARANPAQLLKTSASPTPLRSPARTLRIWIAPWKDTDGNLMGETAAYVKTDDGDWQIDTVRADIKRAYAPTLTAPPRAAASHEESKPAPAAASSALFSAGAPKEE